MSDFHRHQHSKKKVNTNKHTIIKSYKSLLKYFPSMSSIIFFFWVFILFSSWYFLLFYTSYIFHINKIYFSLFPLRSPCLFYSPLNNNFSTLLFKLLCDMSFMLYSDDDVVAHHIMDYRSFPYNIFDVKGINYLFNAHIMPFHVCSYFSTCYVCLYSTRNTKYTIWTTTTYPLFNLIHPFILMKSIFTDTTHKTRHTRSFKQEKWIEKQMNVNGEKEQEEWVS